jgi:hypothetical protein
MEVIRMTSLSDVIGYIDDANVATHLGGLAAQKEIHDEQMHNAKMHPLYGKIIGRQADGIPHPGTERVAFKQFEGVDLSIRTISAEKAQRGNGVPIVLYHDGQKEIIYLSKESMKTRFPKIGAEEFSAVIHGVQQKAAEEDGGGPLQRKSRAPAIINDVRVRGEEYFKAEGGCLQRGRVFATLNIRGDQDALT